MSNKGGWVMKVRSEVDWSGNGDSWRSGGASITNKRLTSYDLIAGHSAGGQSVNQNGMAKQIHEKLGVSVQYGVANPFSYAYLDAMGPAAEGTFKAFMADRVKVTQKITEVPLCGRNARCLFTAETAWPSLFPKQ